MMVIRGPESAKGPNDEPVEVQVAHLDSGRVALSVFDGADDDADEVYSIDMSAEAWETLRR